MFRKRARIQGWRLAGLDSLPPDLPRERRMLLTGRPHRVLEGSKMTSGAAAYPGEFALQAAAVHFSSENNASLENMWPLIHH